MSVINSLLHVNGIPISTSFVYNRLSVFCLVGFGFGWFWLSFSFGCCCCCIWVWFFLVCFVVWCEIPNELVPTVSEQKMITLFIGINEQNHLIQQLKSSFFWYRKWKECSWSNPAVARCEGMLDLSLVNNISPAFAMLDNVDHAKFLLILCVIYKQNMDALKNEKLHTWWLLMCYNYLQNDKKFDF